MTVAEILLAMKLLDDVLQIILKATSVSSMPENYPILRELNSVIEELRALGGKNVYANEGTPDPASTSAKNNDPETSTGTHQ
jgi:hypothetical protein